MSGAGSDVARVLLPDAQWYSVDPGSYRVWSGKDGGRFEFRQSGTVYRGPVSSVKATIENTSTSSNTA